MIEGANSANAPAPAIAADAQWSMQHPGPATNVTTDVFFTLVVTGPDAVVSIFLNSTGWQRPNELINASCLELLHAHNSHMHLTGETNSATNILLPALQSLLAQ